MFGAVHWGAGADKQSSWATFEFWDKSPQSVSWLKLQTIMKELQLFLLAFHSRVVELFRYSPQFRYFLPGICAGLANIVSISGWSSRQRSGTWLWHSVAPRLASFSLLQSRFWYPGRMVSVTAMSYLRQEEFPYKLGQTLVSAEDLRLPRDLHPIFFGCFDWHRCQIGFGKDFECYSPKCPQFGPRSLAACPSCGSFPRHWARSQCLDRLWRTVHCREGKNSSSWGKELLFRLVQSWPTSSRSLAPPLREPTGGPGCSNFKKSLKQVQRFLIK